MASKNIIPSQFYSLSLDKTCPAWNYIFECLVTNFLLNSNNSTKQPLDNYCPINNNNKN